MRNIFSFWAQVLKNGNRQDYELEGDDWHSWQADAFDGISEQFDRGHAHIEVTNEDGVTLRIYYVTWERMDA